MKLTFRGWQREVTPHSHSVIPVEFIKERYSSKGAGQPLTWNGPLSAFGKVTGLGLSGSFLVEFEFEAPELRNWLEQYVRGNPEAASACFPKCRQKPSSNLAGRRPLRLREKGKPQHEPRYA
jgi:hypothetical protein